MFTILSILTGGGLIGGIAMLVLRPALREVVGGFARSIPGWVWAAVAGLLLLGALFWWHSSAVSAAYDRGKVAGAAAQDAAWQAAFDEMKRGADLWKQNYETEADKSAALLGAQHDQNLHDIAARGDDLRLRGPGKAAGCGGPGSNTRLSAGPGEQTSPAAPANDPADRMPEPDRIAIVPWGWLVKSAEDHDELLDEVTTWRTWHDHQKAAHDAAVARLKAQMPDPAFSKEPE